MTKKITIGLVLSVLLLVIAEYILLEEVFSYNRKPVIAGTVLCIILSIIVCLYFFKQFRKASGE